jgi:N-acetylglucosaminyl-diphospho-decaprenol L-rhamnosyltransferase
VAGPPLSLVVVHRDRADRCVRTVAGFLDQGLPLRVMVVDNGSPPAVVTALRAQLPPAVEVIATGANLGFGPAANVGFRAFLARDPAEAGEWVALCPHDALPDPGCITRMLEAVAARPRAGLASADFGDGATPVVDRYFGGILAPATVDVGWEPAGHPHGTLLLARRGCLDDVGLFDERYFAYGEEADLALRATAAGWEVGLVRGAVIRNPDVGSHIAVVDYLQLRNTLLLVREHFGRYPAFIRFVIALWHLGSGYVVRSRRGPYYDAPARVRALVDHLRHRYGPPPASVLAR